MGARGARWAIRLTLRVLKQAGGRHLEDPGPAGILMLHSQDLPSLSVSYPDWFMLSGREGNGRTPEGVSETRVQVSSLLLWGFTALNKLFLCLQLQLRHL